MSELNIQETTQYRITELMLVTKAGYIDIKDKFDELNIFDSMLKIYNIKCESINMEMC
jgi:hypothetical protein